MSDYNPSDAGDVYEKMMHIMMPPNVGPRKFSGDQYVFDDVPSMLKVPTSIPLVHFIGGNRNKPVTYAGVHTMDSLAQYAEAPKIQRLIDQLLPIVWGCPSHDNVPAKCPIFKIEGLKKINQVNRIILSPMMALITSGLQYWKAMILVLHNLPCSR
jgi:hypothetical protein